MASTDQLKLDSVHLNWSAGARCGQKHPVIQIKKFVASGYADCVHPLLASIELDQSSGRP